MVNDRLLVLTRKEAQRRFPEYISHPRVSFLRVVSGFFPRSGSIEEMRKKYRWYGLIIRVGGYYYWLDDNKKR